MALNRFTRWIVGVGVSQVLALLLLSWILPDFALSSLWAAMLLSLSITLAISLFGPTVYRFAARLAPIMFPILSFLLTTAAVFLSVEVVNLIDDGAVTLDSIEAALLLVMLLSILDTLLGAVFSISDEISYRRFVLEPLAGRYRGVPRSDIPGIVYIQLDGLALPILERAVAGGYLPTLKRWIESGSHRLVGWEPDLSSQTSASQAGILLGDNTDIAAFRWWDKNDGTLKNSKTMATARELEERLSSGNGLLATGGVSRFNIFSGDATDCIGTFSRIGASSKPGNGQRSYFAYFASPYMIARTLGRYVSEVIRELYQARRQRVKDIRPRTARSFKYALLRGGTNVFLHEASAYVVAADMLQGTSAIYTTFFAYDEVAHNAGIERSDALKTLRKIDEVLARLERVARMAPRPYRIVVLSDHGQSQGATFSDRFGYGLGELVGQLASEVEVISPEAPDEGFGELNAALTEAISLGSRTTRMIRRTLRRRTQDGIVELAPEPSLEAAELQRTDSPVEAVVLASGNLGLISFPDWPERMTFEQLSERFPNLMRELPRHPGISFIMVHSAIDGGLAIGPEGIHYLDRGEVVGNDPLAGFGPNAAGHLRRTDGFTTAPDILVISMVDPVTGEVAAFEELVGSHGGLGGTQTQPFLLFPIEFPFDPETPIIGAAGMHRVLKNWIPVSTPTTNMAGPEA